MQTIVRPNGYIEVQRSWVGTIAGHAAVTKEKLGEIADEVRRLHPGFVAWGSRVEIARDGAGVDHFNLYAGFVPPDAETDAPQLNPHNLNETSNTSIGEPLLDNQIGWKETRF